jgi:hypothetical protein
MAPVLGIVLTPAWAFVKSAVLTETLLPDTEIRAEKVVVRGRRFLDD